MVDSRIEKVADILVNYSTKVKKNEVVQIVASPEAFDLVLAIYKRVLQKGAYSLINIGVPGASYIYFKYASEEQLKKFPEIAMYEMKKTNVHISLAAPRNLKELSNVDSKKFALRQKVTDPISEWRVKKTRWVNFDYPTNALAQEAEMSLQEFEDFVYSSCIVDWEKVSKSMDKTKRLVNKTNKVRILGKDTDLTFSIKGRNAVKGDGTYNMPDGELYTSVVENSANGYIYYEFPAIYNSKEVTDIKLEFKNGKIVKASATKNQDFLKQMINMDKGSSHIGEFGIGLNYNIKKFIKNTLFDEKLGGSIHIALGRSYDECLGKNKSALHWDMIKDMRKDGKIYFDNKLVYKNGKFI